MSKRICDHLSGVLAFSVHLAPTKSENILMINLSFHVGDIIISSYSRGRFGGLTKTPTPYRSWARVTLRLLYLKCWIPIGSNTRAIAERLRFNRCPAKAGRFCRLPRRP